MQRRNLRVIASERKREKLIGRKIEIHNTKTIRRVYLSLVAKDDEEAVENIKSLSESINKNMAKIIDYEIISDGFVGG